MFEETLKDRILSIDIETSGLDRKKDWIWSIGIKHGNGRGVEDMIKPESEEKLNALFDNKIFDVEGYFDDYKERIANSETKKIDEALLSMMNEIDDKSVILIQNANFENRFFANAFSRTGIDMEPIEDKFGYVSDVHKNRMFYTPPGVTVARQKAARRFAAMKIASTPEESNRLLSGVNKAYKGVLSEYERAIKSGNGAVVIELQDITSATWAMAAENGLIDRRNINIGKSVDFLSKSLFGEKEAHTALSDAEVQLKVFRKLSEMYSEIESGDASMATYDAFARIKAAQPHQTARQFVSGLRNAFEEIDRNGETLIIPEIPIYDKFITINGGGEYHRIGVMDRKNLPTAKTYGEAAEMVKRRYKHSVMPNIDGRGMNDFVDRVMSMDKNHGEYLKNVEKQIDENLEKRLLGTTSFTEEIGDSITMIKSSKHYSKLKMGALSAVALAGVMYMSSGSTEVKESKKREKDKKKEPFRMFSDAGMHHGTGFYSWDNAVGHHAY